MGKIKNTLKKVPGLSWIAKTNKSIYDLQVKTEKLESRVNDLEIQLNKACGLLFLDNEKKEINKIAVFTALIGDYDDLNEPNIVKNDYCDYYCFTDNKKLTSKTWNIIYFDKKKYKELKNCDNVKIARYIKTHPHTLLKKYKHSIFIDANLTINKSLIEWYCLYSNGNDILTFKHPDRNCIYEEGNKCIEMNKDKEEIINKQLDKYRKAKYPTDNGLVMTNMMYRHHNAKTNKFNEAWWKEILNGSRRDQLSFNYVQWKTKQLVDLCPLHAAFNDYFIYNYHPNENK